MENKPSVSVFGDIHKKIQDKKDSLRKANEQRAGISRDEAEKEAVEKGFDRPAVKPKDEIMQ